MALSRFSIRAPMPRMRLRSSAPSVRTRRPAGPANAALAGGSSAPWKASDRTDRNKDRSNRGADAASPPGFKGDTAQGGSKQVELETGAMVSVPLFINTGDTIRINTQTGEYVERVEKGG